MQSPNTVSVNSTKRDVLRDRLRSASMAIIEEPMTEAIAVRRDVRARPRTEKFLLTNV